MDTALDFDTIRSIIEKNADKVEALIVDEAGHVWIGASEGGVSEFDGQTWTTYTKEDGLGSTFRRKRFYSQCIRGHLGDIGNQVKSHV